MAEVEKVPWFEVRVGQNSLTLALLHGGYSRSELEWGQLIPLPPFQATSHIASLTLTHAESLTDLFKHNTFNLNFLESN